MAVFRVERNSGYTVMSNHHLRNKELTLKAKGLLSQMLSLPEDWDYTLAGLSHINRESIDAIRTAVWELEKAGYILRRQGRDEKGKMTAIEYTIYEQPQPVLENPIPGKGSIQTTQEVEIYFNFVGRFVPPAFGEVELTPEELEEIRKREERKDRLHQNYLKRKASGAQKRYEDKIKERKKAEIEAKKAAIRAEDIAKGVFVPVSSLPQREPMKGVQSA